MMFAIQGPSKMGVGKQSFPLDIVIFQWFFRGEGTNEAVPNTQ